MLFTTVIVERIKRYKAFWGEGLDGLDPALRHWSKPCGSWEIFCIPIPRKGLGCSNQPPIILQEHEEFDSLLEKI